MNPIDIIDKYYADNPALRDILLRHSRQVAHRALRIVDAHPEWQVDREFVQEAAILHDIGIRFCQAPSIYCYGEHPYIQHGRLGAQLLRTEGLPRHADVAERHTGTGITKEQIQKENLPLPLQDFCPRTLEEQIICYADKFYSKTHLGKTKSLHKIREGLQRHGNASLQQFDQWHKVFKTK
ncbi:MAG: HD domain-containing protein [Paludibacter sp.]|nr:HD domain-containing protein [Bacteroidales bacterium]MCM1069874.1 HD domain-containing protein [Prevotella sp.]MCM1353053.1 HD domain-containing protein [Bacteroides sp.]MCM1443410.1 HD domain-containing protein [Muribaculum sp.]MCM1481218.1 HD domain-containing protein [Paludibacter sp.]